MPAVKQPFHCCNRNQDFVGRTERQRVPARQRIKEKPELASFDPAFTYQIVIDRELVLQNWQRAISLAFHRDASASV